MVVQNRLLAGMAPETFDHLRSWLQPIALKRRAILQEYDRRIEHIYFIERGLASVFARTRRDGPVEVYIVGRLGLVGVSAVLTRGTAAFTGLRSRGARSKYATGLM
jgi:CRP-like cAMP-binding protein